MLTHKATDFVFLVAFTAPLNCAHFTQQLCFISYASLYGSTCSTSFCSCFCNLHIHLELVLIFIRIHHLTLICGGSYLLATPHPGLSNTLSALSCVTSICLLTKIRQQTPSTTPSCNRWRMATRACAAFWSPL